MIKVNDISLNRPVGQVVAHLHLEQEVRGSNLGLVKLNTVLPTTRHCCDIFSKVVVLPIGVMTWTRALQTRYMLQRNTASIMKDFILI